MAFVGISNKLLSDVREACRRMCHAEQNTVGDVGYVLVDDNSSWFKELAYGEHVNLMGIIPKEWTKRSTGYGSFIVRDGDERYELSVNYDNSNGVSGLPPKFTDYRGFTTDITNPRLPADVLDKIAKSKARHEIERRWNDVRTKVVEFLNSCKSLNEALKLWPEIEHYIPKEYMERVLQKREKSTTVSRAAEVLGSIDTQELTAAAVIARLSGATV